MHSAQDKNFLQPEYDARRTTQGKAGGRLMAVGKTQSEEHKAQSGGNPLRTIRMAKRGSGQTSVSAGIVSVNGKAA